MVFVSYLSLFVVIIRLADSVCIPLAKDNYIKQQILENKCLLAKTSQKLRRSENGRNGAIVLLCKLDLKKLPYLKLTNQIYTLQEHTYD